MRTGDGQQLPSTLVAPGAGEAGRDHDRRAGAVRGGVAEHVGDPVGRHGDHDQVDRAVEVAEAAAGGEAVDRLRLGVDHVERPGVRRAADRFEHAVAETARGASYADDRHAGRVEQRAERPRRGAPLTPVGSLHGLAGGVRPQLDLHLARDRRAGGPEPGRAEDAQHAVVVAEDLRLEAADPVPPAEGGEVLEQQAAQAPATVLVGDQEGDLGAVGGEHLGGRQAGDPTADECDQRGRGGVVRSEEVVDVMPTGLPAGGEEAQPQRVHRDATRAARAPRRGRPRRRTGSRRSCRRRGARPPARRSTPGGRRRGHPQRSRHQRARARPRRASAGARRGQARSGFRPGGAAPGRGRVRAARPRACAWPPGARRGARR